jgi:predicted small secreted protein
MPPIGLRPYGSTPHLNDHVCDLTLQIGAALLTVSLTGCNTTSGAGEDIEDFGEEVQDVAD